MNNFQSKFTPELPELLHRLNGSIMLTTYQTGKVICISSDGSRLIQLIRDFPIPMGMSLEGDILAMALQNNITVFKGDAHLADTYAAKPNTYDTLYYPTTTHHTGYVDAHDVVFSNQGLTFVNTAFSCLAKVSESFSFEPVWKPPFIKKYAMGDACHLNGVCVDENRNLSWWQ